MTTVTALDVVVTGGVDTHQDLHVAAVLDQLGRVLGSASFPTSVGGYRQLLAWLRQQGRLDKIGVEGTGSYGAAVTRHLAEHDVEVIEVARPNRQVRRRYGKTDVVDAIAAARAVQSGEATGKPTSHDGPVVEALRTLKAAQRSANKARTQVLNQMHQLLVTAPEDLRARLRPLKRTELLSTCAAFRISPDDDSVPAMTRLAMRELAQRIPHLDEQLALVSTRLRARPKPSAASSAAWPARSTTPGPQQPPLNSRASPTGDARTASCPACRCECRRRRRRICRRVQRHHPLAGLSSPF